GRDLQPRPVPARARAGQDLEADPRGVPALGGRQGQVPEAVRGQVQAEDVARGARVPASAARGAQAVPRRAGRPVRRVRRERRDRGLVRPTEGERAGPRRTPRSGPLRPGETSGRTSRPASGSPTTRRSPGAPAPSEEKRIRACSETRRSPARAVRSGRGFGACGPPRKGRTERATRDLAAVPFRYAGDNPRAVQSTTGGLEPAEVRGARVLEDRHPDTVEVVVDPVSLTKPEAVFGDVPLSGISRSRRPGAWA